MSGVPGDDAPEGRTPAFNVTRSFRLIDSSKRFETEASKGPSLALAMPIATSVSSAKPKRSVPPAGASAAMSALM